MAGKTSPVVIRASYQVLTTNKCLKKKCMQRLWQLLQLSKGSFFSLMLKEFWTYKINRFCSYVSIVKHSYQANWRRENLILKPVGVINRTRTSIQMIFWLVDRKIGSFKFFICSYSKLYPFCFLVSIRWKFYCRRAILVYFLPCPKIEFQWLSWHEFPIILCKIW